MSVVSNSSLQNIIDHSKNQLGFHTKGLEKLNDFELVKRHRIDAIFPIEYLEEFTTDEFKRKVEKRRVKMTVKALKMLKTLNQFKQILEIENIEFLLLKGIPLKYLLFKNSEKRISRDIDALVKPMDVKTVFQLLKRKGFHLSTPLIEFKEEQWPLFLKEFDQVSFFHKETRVSIEIHWKLFRNESYFPVEESTLWKNRKTFNVGNVEFQSLSTPIHAVYISLHGAQHQWDSLVWIMDMYFLHNIMTNEEKEQSVLVAKKYNVLETYVLGYLMAKMIFELKVDSMFEIHFSKKVQKMASASIQFLERNSSTAGSKIGVVKRMLYLLKLQPSYIGKLHHFYNFPIYSMKHQSSRRKFVHWSLRPITQIKEKRFKNKN